MIEKKPLGREQAIFPHLETFANKIGIGGFTMQGTFTLIKDNKEIRFIDYVSLIRPYEYFSGAIMKTYIPQKGVVPITELPSDVKQADVITVALVTTKEQLYASIRTSEFQRSKNMTNSFTDFHNHIALSVEKDPDQEPINPEDIVSVQRWVSYKLMTDYLRTTLSDV